MTGPNPDVLVTSPYGVAFAWLAQLQTDLRETRAGLPPTCVLYPGTGDPPMYECPEMAWVTVQSMQPYDGEAGPFSQQIRPGRVIPGWRISLRAGVYRCFPVEKNLGMPGPAVLDSLLRDETDDLLALTESASLNPYWQQAGAYPVIGTARPVAVSGGRHGVTLDVNVFATDWCHGADDVLPKLPGDPRATD